jgi:hypothetical protein
MLIPYELQRTYVCQLAMAFSMASILQAVFASCVSNV